MRGRLLSNVEVKTGGILEKPQEGGRKRNPNDAVCGHRKGSCRNHPACLGTEQDYRCGDGMTGPRQKKRGISLNGFLPVGCNSGSLFSIGSERRDRLVSRIIFAR